MNANWWQSRREELLTLAEKQCPLYVYNEETVNDLFFDLLSIDSLQGLLYPVSMNPHQKILRKAFEMDLGFSCISTGAWRGFFDQLCQPNLHPLFFIAYNTDDINALQDSPYWTDLILTDPQVFKTYSNSSLDREKKGIHIFLDSKTRLDFIQWSEINPNGFYISQKSFLPSSDESKKIHSFITKASNSFPEANTLILGNYSIAGPNFEIRDLDIRSIEESIAILNDSCPRLSLWLEVPAFMLSSSGVLIVKVLETGEKEKKPYIRINADINAFMNYKSIKARPNLMNLSSSHETEPVTNEPGETRDAERGSDAGGGGTHRLHRRTHRLVWLSQREHIHLLARQ